MKDGTILNVRNDGLAYLRDETGNAYSFTFDKVSGYMGESASTFGLVNGAKVTFDVVDDKVKSVVLLKEKNSKQAIS